jgi:hypothetical protein
MKPGVTAIAAMTLVLVACGRKDEAPGTGPAASASPTASAAGAEDSADPDAVPAVLQSQGAPVAGLSFVIESRPVIGKPFAVRLLATAEQPLPALLVSVESSSLIVSPASGVLSIAGAGDPASHELAVTAQQAGLAEITVRLRGEGEDAVETAYAIPVLVSAAAAE